MNPDPHDKLAGVHPKLAACVVSASGLCSQPFEVVQGLRTSEQQAALYAQGRTAPGPIVTWVQVSNHEAKPDGFGHAVDLAALDPDKSGGIDWNTAADYETIRDAMFAAAKVVGITLRWGGDWHMTGSATPVDSDVDHFEIHSIP